MAASIFVSRHLEAISPIQDIARQYKLELTHRSLLKFEAVDFEAPDTKWLFFYSKTGVKYFSNYCSLSHYKIGCYGLATAAYCMKFSHVSFQCDANTEIGIKKVEEYIGAESLTFILGKKSLRSLQKAIPQRTNHKEVIVYDQAKSQDSELNLYDLAILTSPMNADSFFDNGGKAFEYIAIGETTGKTLRKYGIDPMVAVKPSEDGIAESLVSALKTYF